MSRVLLKAGPARSRRQAPRQGATRKVKATGPSRGTLRLQLWINRVLLLLAVVAVAVAAGYGVTRLREIPVQRITVAGKLEHVSREALEALVAPALAGGFLSADLGRIRTQLQELPWVYRASVRRQWPSTLEIRVEEQLPIARWGEQGFLNHEGEMFQSLSASEWQELPLLVGPPGSERQMMADYLHLGQWLAPLGLAVVELELNIRGELQARLDQGFALLLGRGDLLERMQRFTLVYQRELQDQGAGLARVDLRYNNGVAVAFREQSRVAGLPGTF